jgi:Glutathione S-transferase, N-terminal domain
MSGNIVVHHLNNSRSQRVLWVLVCPSSLFGAALLIHFKEEFNVPYEIKLHQRTPEMLAPKELRNVHPLGKSPIITDGDITLAESGAIIRACPVFHSSLFTDMLTKSTLSISMGTTALLHLKRANSQTYIVTSISFVARFEMANREPTSHSLFRRLADASSRYSIHFFYGTRQSSVFPSSAP